MNPLRANYTNKAELDYQVSYARPDSLTNSPYLPYLTNIKTKLLSLAKKYYRIGSASVQDEIMYGSLLTASNMIENMLNLVLIPKLITINFNRFPWYNAVLPVPRGPLLLSGTFATSMTLKYTLDEQSPLAESLSVVIGNDTPGSAYVKLFTDYSDTSLVLKGSNVWPTPLYTEVWPIQFQAYFGQFAPDFWSSASEEDIMSTYSESLIVLFQLGLHLYENRMPVNQVSMSDVPLTYRTLINNLRRGR